MKEDLPRVYWHMGQALLPDHFYAQEESLRAEIDLRLSAFPLPDYGLIDIEWSRSLLPDGIFSIEKANLVFRSGYVISIPESAERAEIDLNLSGSTHVSIYLHLLSDFDPEAQSSSDDIKRIRHKIKLSTKAFLDGSADTIKLAEFEKNIDSIWSVSKKYIPTSLSVNHNPFFTPILERIRNLLKTFHGTLIENIEVNYLGGESLFLAKQCLRGTYQFLGVLSDIRSKVKIHPHELFKALRSFYLDLSIYYNIDPALIQNVYDHDDLKQCFEPFVESIENKVNKSKKFNPYIGFVNQDGVYLLSEFPEELKDASRVFLLVQKQNPSESLSIEGLKIASVSRLGAVHQLALRGIPFEKIESPPFNHSFGAEVEFYGLEPGEEWDHVIKESALGFFDSDALKGKNFFLYWRND